MSLYSHIPSPQERAKRQLKRKPLLACEVNTGLGKFPGGVVLAPPSMDATHRPEGFHQTQLRALARELKRLVAPCKGLVGIAQQIQLFSQLRAVQLARILYIGIPAVLFRIIAAQTLLQV